MAVKWDSAMDQRLLLLIISMVTLNWTQVASQWAQVYGQQDVQQPTKKAIVEHLAKLRKAVGGAGSPNKGSSTTAAASTSSAASSFRETSSGRVNKKASPSATGSTSSYKGKGKRKIVDSDSDDSEHEPEHSWPEKVKKGEETEDVKPRLFGEVAASVTRPSLPRTARPEPGAFATEHAADDDNPFMLNDIYDSEADSDTTVQNTPSNTPMPDASTRPTPSFAHTPAPWAQTTPVSTPTPALRARDSEDDNNCIVVRSLSKKPSGRK